MTPVRPKSRRDDLSSTSPRQQVDRSGRNSHSSSSPMTSQEEQDLAVYRAERIVPPTRSSTEPVARGVARTASFPRSSNRRSLALDTNRALGHEQHVLFPIQSRDLMAETESASGRAGTDSGNNHSQGRSVAKTADVSTSTTPVNDKATKNLRDSIRRLRPGKTKKEKAKKALYNASWKESVMDILAAMYQRIIVEALLRRKPLAPSKDGRHVPLNPASHLIDERSQKPYISNFIRSSRYTAYNFVPKQLLFQFSKLGNFYFLVMGILQMIPGLSTVGRWTTIVPLSIFVAFSMAKEGYDDYRRYQLDKFENRSETWILNRGAQGGSGRGKQAEKLAQARDEDTDLERGVRAKTVALAETSDWARTQWQNIKVGDVVRLKRNDGVPADMILLHATGPNGIAYIETMALDGETNLKSKQACPLLAERCNTLDGIKSTQATVVSEDPNIDLYSYDGRARVGEETSPLSLNNVVYRGSALRNTTEAIGLVVNSGEECKIRMNANKNVTAKKPAMHSIINKMVLFQIVIVLMLAIGFTIGYHLWKNDVQDKSFYLVTNGRWSASVPFREIFFGYLIMFNTLIPLSLYISMEIVKIGQLILLHDVDMYDPVTDTPMVANTTTILENLGQVSYVFSDKTGTLTENVMRFRKMSVAGVACLHDMDVHRDEQIKQKKIEASKLGRRRKGKQRASRYQPAPPTSPHKDKFFDNDEVNILYENEEHDDDDQYGHDGLAPPKRQGSFASASHWKSSVRPNEEPELKTEDMLDYIRRKPNTVFSRKAKHFLLCIALCHTCLPEQQDNGEFSFQAASPDELALVEAARDMGWLVIDRPAQTIKLQMTDDKGFLQTESYQVLDVIEFSSKRKRMSIIIRMPDGRICVFCKGADNVIMSRLKMSHLAEQKFQDISRRASVRKTFEQDKARTRMSMASGRGTPRTSMAMKRGESVDRLEGMRRSIGRRSTDLHRLSYHEIVSPRLARRQTDEFATSTTPRSSMDILRSYSPRPSLSQLPSTENIVDRRIDESVAASEAAVFEQCFQHVDDFASEGLRTLLYAYRYLDEEAYSCWKELYREAETSLVNRQELVEEAGEIIEQKFELAGATAIEDKLQDGVPETIDKLRRANVKVWMLTGDKRETAINIGHSARVCKPFSEIYIIDRQHGSLQDTLTTTLNDVGRGMVPHSVVVVDGQTLATIDADDDLAVLFYDLILRVDSVICCRASPSQKANLVKSIRRFVPKSMTLAIGDGANDIGMIQASHVGIGISGREGLQASRISDYSIAQFRFLQQLLFVHGRWNYLRTGKYVLATFWKEIIFFLAQAHFQRFNGYSGTSLFESWSLTVFNSLFTSLPVILLGIFEKDLSAETLLAVPELYTFGQQNRGFSFTQYFGWMLMGVIGSFVIYYFTWAEYTMALFTQDTTLYAMGALCFTVGVIFINIKLLILELHHKTVITFGGFLISVAGWFLWCLFLSGMYPKKVGKDMVRGAFIHNFGRQLSWWTTLLLAIATLVIIDLVVQGVRRVYWPTDQDLMQRIEKDASAQQALREHAALMEQGVSEDDIEMQDLIVQGGSGGDPSKDVQVPRASFQAERKTARVSVDDYRPPNFTPPAEEVADPFGMRTARAET
ncbi:drs2 neo1 protein [Conoideocrella luteorostrata]|uniref:Phospholipid-transporting ATPase n=1 Tax=Conoideocrella luteorostrata TaxID=1105319 RepID=A0AAJ0FZK2_9HYPO|nr:drs2 neo1 protein [Conoideocrella luteorostrata]